MKNISTFYFCVICIMLSTAVMAQKSKSPTPSFHLGSSINYFQNRTPLTTILDNSEYDFNERYALETEDYPVPRINVGLYATFIHKKQFFHTLGCTRIARSTKTIQRQVDTLFLDEKSSYTSIGLRYEFGKLFGDPKSKVRFGVSGGLENNFYHYKSKYLLSESSLKKGSILSLDVSIIPSLVFRLSDQLFIDFKTIPYWHITDMGIIKHYANAPNQPGAGDKKIIHHDQPFNLNVQLGIRFLLEKDEKQ